MRIFRAAKSIHKRRETAFLPSLFKESHIRQFAIIIILILISQVVAWFFFEIFLEMSVPDSQHIFMEVLFLTLSLAIILFPILYHFAYRPQRKTIKRLQAAQQQLETLNQELLVTSEAERQAHQLADTLLSANQALEQTLCLDSIADTLFDFLYDFAPFDGATILMPKTQDTWAVLKSICCESGTKVVIENPQIFDVESSSYLEAFIAEKRLVLISDAHAYEAWQPWAERNGCRSWLALPFIADGSVIGICELYKKCPDFFTAEHVKLAEALVQVAAKALQNAQLYDQVHSGRKSLQLLSHRLVEVQETERRYIARELHDEAGQGLASLMVSLRLLERHVNNPEAVMAGIEGLKQNLNDVSDELHRLAVRLRPASLDHLGIVPALNQHIEDFAAKYDITAQFESVDINGRLPLEVETAVYRIVQEGLTNIVRHGQATRADILLQNRGNKLVIIIEDNGIGFIPETVNKSEHLGLVGIAERAEMLNGSMAIESTPGIGTTLFVEVPYETAHTNN